MKIASMGSLHTGPKLSGKIKIVVGLHVYALVLAMDLLVIFAEN